MADPIKIQIRNLNPEIHMAAKIAAIKKGISLNQYYIEAIEARVKKDREKS